MSEEPRKRSRFDQTEPPRKSRFDRRSRSPAREGSHDGAVASVESPADKSAAAAAAAAAAAKINASINAKKGIQHVDVPPIRATESPGAAGGAKSPSQPSSTLNAEIYTQDGDYIRDIEINDLRNRYTLTKGSTQKMIKEKTGADVTTRGNYYPDKSLATAANPPLYLHITSTTKDGLEKAVQEVEQLMSQDLPNLVDERRFRRRDQEERPQFERDHLGRRKWPEERIPIDLEPIPGFNLRAQVVGAGGSYVKHIQAETRCRVQIKGRGSGFMEHDTGVESDEPMYLHVAGPDPTEVERAKSMCLDLLGSVKDSYDAFKERGPRGGGDRFDRGGGGGGYGGNDRGSYHERDRNSSYGGNSQYGGQSQYGGGYGQQTVGYGGAQSPTQGTPGAAAPASGGAMSPTSSAETAQQMQAWAAYYAQNPSQDPYAAYGGYGTVMAAYMQNPQAYYQQGSGQGQGMGPQMSVQDANGLSAGVPPPPPQDEGAQAPPPPPPGNGGMGGYNSVPPPPGM